MILVEFKAWFDGFTEAFGDKIPTAKQWKRIKERVAEIDGRPVTERVYLDRYWTYPYPYYWLINQPGISTGPSWMCNTATGQSASFNSVMAMNALGYTDAQAIS